MEDRISNAGTLYNSNFLITLSDNLRVGFAAGNPGRTEPEDANLWAELRPDILFTQRCKFNVPDFADRMSHAIAISGARIMVPIHIEDAYSGEYDPAEYIAAINKACVEKTCQDGRCF